MIFRDAFLVLRVEEGEEEDDGDGLDSPPTERAHGLNGGVLVQRDDGLALVVHALLRLAAVARKHGRLLLHVDARRAGGVFAGREVPDVVDRAEAFGDEQAHVGAGAGEQRVRADRGAVREGEHVGRSNAVGERLTDTVDDGPAGLVGRGWEFQHGERPGVLVEDDHVRERAAGVYCDRLHIGPVSMGINAGRLSQPARDGQCALQAPRRDARSVR